MPALLVCLLLIVSGALSSCTTPPGGTELLLLTTTELASGKVGDRYRAQLQATGGRDPYVFSIATGFVPGLRMSEEGTLTGTPTEDGAFELVVAVDDDRGTRATAVLHLEVGPDDPPPPEPLRLLQPSLPPAGLLVPYAVELGASGGVPPYTWTIFDAPEELTLDRDTGLLSGTMSVRTSYTFDVELRDSAGERRSRTYELVVLRAPNIDTFVLPIAIVGQPYEAEVDVSQGAFPVSIEVFSGDLPTGLSMSASGQLTGIPTAAESRPVRLRATDAIGQVAERRIRMWSVEGAPHESFVDLPLPPNCDRASPEVVVASIDVPASQMISRAQLAVDLDYEDVGMLNVTLVSPAGVRVPIHVGAARLGGGRSLHFLFEDDRVAWGSFSALAGANPLGTWQVEVVVLPDPGFGCVPLAGRLERVALVFAAETSSDDYLRVTGYSPNNLIDGAFARISGGGLDQHGFDLAVEQWSTGPNGIPEGGAGDDVPGAPPALVWSSDLAPESGTVDPDGHFVTGESTGRGTLRGVAGEIEIEVPVLVVPPDWVP